MTSILLLFSEDLICLVFLETNNNPGWVYVYHRHENNSWLMYQAIQSPLGNNSYFGAAVSVHENSIIVGADGFPNAEITGAAFSYRRDSTTGPYLLESAYPSVAGVKGHFGWAADIVDTFVAVGAYGYGKILHVIVEFFLTHSCFIFR